MKIHKLLPISASAIALCLTACGDDITEQIINKIDNVGAVATQSDLPKCTDEIAGQTAYVTKDKAFFGCNGKDWVELINNTVSVGDNICSSTELEDKSGFEIFCNGESIGTVRNGEKGDKGDQGIQGEQGGTGTSCKIQDSEELSVTIACGTETFTMSLKNFAPAVEEEECAEGDEDCEDLTDVAVSGVSQKGPFTKGATVHAYELLNLKTMKQTGNSFNGTIENSDGTFNISTTTLTSPYAYFVVEGFYLNEVSGKSSTSPIKLRALLNLKSKEKSANINLVTHLEYDYVSKLVLGNDGMKFFDAKKKAENAIFNSFYIDTKNFEGYAENYNVLHKGDGNAALLAVSVLLQGNRSESELTALLASFSIDISDDGIWSNQVDRAQIADWAMEQDLAGKLESIRTNVAGWGIPGTEVPAFESYIKNFWMTELDFEECSEDNAGSIKSIKNKNSAYYASQDSVYSEGDSTLVRFICATSGATHQWRYATDREKDVAALAKDTTQGAVSRGNINTSNIYVFENDAWRRGTDLDARLKFSCIADSIGKTTADTVKQVISYYTCDKDGSKTGETVIPTAWRNSVGIEADTTGFGIPKDGENVVKNGNVEKARYYVYEDEKWRLGTDMDFIFQEGCSKNLKGKINEFNKTYYTCSDERKLVEEIWIEYTWRKSTADEADLYNETCSEDGTVIQGKIDKNNVFVCEGGQWISAGESHLLGECSSDLDGEVKKSPISSNYYVCDFESHGWRMTMDLQDQDPELKGCTLRRSHKTPVENAEGSGFKYIPGEVKAASDGVHYLCKNQRWELASEARWKTYGRKCSSVSGDTLVSYESFEGIKTYFACEVDSFRVATRTEKWLAQYTKPNTSNRCAKQDEGIKFTTKNEGYWECKNGLLKVQPHTLPLRSNTVERTGTSAGVVIGTQTWMRMNSAYSGVTHSTYDGRALDGHGYQYLYADAVKVCENTSIRTKGCTTIFNCNDAGGKATRLPTKEDWEILYQTIGGNLHLEDLYADTSWTFANGTDYYKLNLVASGYDYPNPDLSYNSSKSFGWDRGNGVELWLQDAGYVSFTATKMSFGVESDGLHVHQKPVRCIMKDDAPIPPPPTYN